MLDVRLATDEDLPAILAISNWAALHTPANFAIASEPLEDWRRAFRETHAMYPWLVAAEIGDAGAARVVGFAKASPWKGRCAYAYSAEITVYVHPDAHGRGIGTALYRRLLPTLAAQGYRTVLGGITLPNPASERLHESFGLRCVARFERIGWKFGRWHDVGYWQGQLHAEGAPPPERIRPVAEVVDRAWPSAVGAGP